MSPKKPSSRSLRRHASARGRTRKSAARTAVSPKRTLPKVIAVGRQRGKGAGKLFEALVALQARLRAPGGCPWDREQTHDSLRTYLVEETYEVLDALDSGDPQKLAGELGDVLLQVVFHAELGAEAGRFDIADVIEQIHSKMVRRHPHVFGKAEARTSQQVVKNWEQIKAEERRTERQASHGVGVVSRPRPTSLLDGVSRSQPALLEANQLTRRAARAGFDWQHIDGLFDKLAEETSELKQALEGKDDAGREEELGDLLFMGVNIARFLGLDPEIALKKANRKFASRFQTMEALAAQRGRNLPDLSADELESLWSEAKAAAVGAAPDVKIRS